MLQSLQRDQVTITKPSGEEFTIRCTVNKDKIITSDVDKTIDVGDTIIRTLPNGAVEKYEVLNPQYYNGIKRALKPHYEIKIRKLDVPKSGGIHINNVNNNINTNHINSSINIATLTELSNYITQNTQIENKQEIQNLISELEKAKDEENTTYIGLFLELIEKLIGSGIIPPVFSNLVKTAKKILK